eukprot:SAG11_NODE_553_length_8575_cov_18.074328_6_plen_109_part_00
MDSALRNLVTSNACGNRRIPTGVTHYVTWIVCRSENGKQMGLAPAHWGRRTTVRQTQIETKFEEMIDVCVHSNARSFMKVGKQVRHYHIGTAHLWVSRVVVRRPTGSA